MARGRAVKFDIGALRHSLAQGSTVEQIAASLGVHINTIYRKCKEWNLTGPNLKSFTKAQHRADRRATPMVVVVPPPPGPPPSAAMIRLAEFDPVIARALAIRTGRAVDASEG